MTLRIITIYRVHKPRQFTKFHLLTKSNVSEADKNNNSNYKKIKIYENNINDFPTI